MNYLDIYEHHDLNTTGALLNFSLMGSKDYPDYMNDVADAATKCALPPMTRKENDACMDRTVDKKWDKVKKCFTFDPTDF